MNTEISFLLTEVSFISENNVLLSWTQIEDLNSNLAYSSKQGSSWHLYQNFIPSDFYAHIPIICSNYLWISFHPVLLYYCFITTVCSLQWR